MTKYFPQSISTFKVYQKSYYQNLSMQTLICFLLVSGSGLNLKQLDIGDCGMTDQGARDIARLILLNTPITTLSFTGNKNVTPAGWRVIAQALLRNKKITTLSLDYNNLGDDGARVLAEALKLNRTLISLDLEGNKIGQAGGEYLLSAVDRNSTVEDMTLMPGNKITDETLEKIKQKLNENQTEKRTVHL